MLKGLMGSGTLVESLRRELDASAVRTREIAHRVANSSNGQAASFESALDDAMAASEADVDLEVEMVRLADEQIRFEAMTRILQNVYAHVRSSIRSR